MHKVLREFTDMAHEFEKALVDHFHLESLANKNIYSIGEQIRRRTSAVERQAARKGQIPFNQAPLFYHFHGSGCTFNYRNIHLQYDASPERDGGIAISVWPIYKFLSASLDNVSKDTVFILLEEQAALGNLIVLGKGWYRIKL